MHARTHVHVPSRSDGWDRSSPTKKDAGIEQRRGPPENRGEPFLGTSAGCRTAANSRPRPRKSAGLRLENRVHGITSPCSNGSIPSADRRCSSLGGLRFHERIMMRSTWGGRYIERERGVEREGERERGREGGNRERGREREGK